MSSDPFRTSGDAGSPGVFAAAGPLAARRLVDVGRVSAFDSGRKSFE